MNKNEAVKAFAVVPVGTDGKYAIQRTKDGTVSYMARASDASKIGCYDLGLAKATLTVFDYGYGSDDQYVWLQWPSDHLSYLKPMSMYPPQRRSSYDTLGRAA